MIADTFATVFPETTLWWGNMNPSKPIIGLVGSRQPVRLDQQVLASRLVELNQQSKGNDRQLATVDDFLLASIGAWRNQPPSILNTDEYPRVEFWTPQSLIAGNLLREQSFAKFYEEVLSKLPPANLAKESTTHLYSEAEIARGRQTQRFLLFGQ